MALHSACDADERIVRQHWDVVVIGTGMGGATLGHRLAMAGQRVLFCEKGRSSLADANALRGEYPEMSGLQPGKSLDLGSAELLMRSGRLAQELAFERNPSRLQRFIPFTGAGTGGSSALYGMALERFLPADFEARAHHADAVDSSLDDAWPVSYDAMVPYYVAAERLYRVKGTDDPLGPPRAPNERLQPPPQMTAGAEELFGFLRSKRLHPYRLPMACEFVADCQGCQSYLCARNCKNDSSRICLRPAIDTFGAQLLDECEVLTLEAGPRRVDGVLCSVRGKTVRLKADRVVLAAGALQTPAILLRSASADWPNGLANASGMVGRNLMRHFIDLYAVEPAMASDSPGFDNRFKELAFNDFYKIDGMKLGSVQSFGRLPPAEMLFGSLMQDLKDSRFARLAPWLGAIRRVAMPTLRRLESGSTVLATTMEDLPYSDNLVVCGTSHDRSGDMTLRYRIRPEGLRRIKSMRRLMRDALNGLRWRRIDQATNLQRIAHACGTCRFGTSPSTSVIDPENRAHGIDNLYVVDSSFFPSSGGTNPSLTIAANALRVADRMITASQGR